MSVEPDKPHTAHKAKAPASVKCAILTVSDSRTERTDRSGAAIREKLEAAGHRVAISQIVPDDEERVASSVRTLAADATIDAVLVTGGTGIADRDHTYEAVHNLFTLTIDGFGELFRVLSYQEIGPAAMLSRATAGLVGKTVVFALPGSPAACALALDRLILPELGHAVSLVNPRRAAE